MLALPKRRTKPVAIVSDAVDRFQRSFKESVLIDELIRKEKVATTSIGRNDYRQRRFHRLIFYAAISR